MGFALSVLDAGGLLVSMSRAGKMSIRPVVLTLVGNIQIARTH